MHIRLRLLVLGLALLLPGCKKIAEEIVEATLGDFIERIKEIKFSPIIFLGPELEGAPDAVEIGGRRYVLEAHLTREPEGILVEVTAVPDDGLPFPGDLDVTEVVLVQGGESWATDIRGLFAGFPILLGGGPLWEIGTRADVILRIEEADGSEHVLAARDVLIVAPA